MVRPAAAVVELNYDWLNCFTRTRGSGLGTELAESNDGDGVRLASAPIGLE